MRSGYCIQGGDNPAMHAKCTQPGRCLCDCHQTVAAIEPGEEPTVYPCPECDRTFDTAQGRSMHKTRTHTKGGWSNKKTTPAEPLPPIKVPLVPEPEPEDQAAAVDHMTTALYAITGWYGGLYIDFTVDTGTDLIDPDTLSAVMDLTRVLEAE